MILCYFLMVYLMGVVCCLDKVMIFYDCMDQTNIDFFVNQLNATFGKTSFDLDYEFIPYGNTKMTKITNDNYQFECERGPNHCDLLKLHAIVSTLHLYSSKLQYLCCLMQLKFTNISNMIKECNTQIYTVDPQAFNMVFEHSDVQLALYGNITRMHRVTRFPTVFINDERLDDFQSDILHNFGKFMEVYNNCRKNVHMVDTACLMEHFPKSSATIISTYSVIFLLLLIQLFKFFF